MTTRTKGIRLDSELWEKIDSCKGDSCRNDFVKNAILKQLNEFNDKSIPEAKVVKISYDGKTWSDLP
jgi:hypothetical protein